MEAYKTTCPDCGYVRFWTGYKTSTGKTEAQLAQMGKDHTVCRRCGSGKALTELVGEPDIGVIAIQEDYVEYVGDLMAQVKQGKNLTPVIIEVPSKYGTKYRDVSEYYRAYIRKFIGFDIEI